MEDYEIIEESQSKNTSITLECINEFSFVKLGSEKKELTTMIHIAAPKLESVAERKKNLRMVSVIDVSGSMTGDKLNLAKEALEFMAQELASTDEFGIVAFETDVSVVLPVMKMNDENKKLALHRIKEMQTGGCTNLSGGLFSGIDQVRSSHTGNSINAVLLFTDGQANNGITSSVQLLHALNKKINNINDHVLYTFGFGDDHNSKLLKSIADTGYGTYSFIQNTSAMKEILINCLGGLMSSIAQNLKLTITPSDNVEIVRVWTRFKYTTEGSSTIVSIKDLFSEEKRDILVILKTDNVTESTNHNINLVTYNLTYDNIMTGLNDQITQVASIKLSETECTEKPNLMLDEQRNRMIMLDELEKANIEAEKGNLNKANEYIDTAKNKIFSSPSHDTSYTTSVLKNINDIQAGFKNEEEYTSRGCKLYADGMSTNVAQRCTNVVSDSDSENDESEQKKVKNISKAYANNFQKTMQKKSRAL